MKNIMSKRLGIKWTWPKWPLTIPEVRRTPNMKYHQSMYKGYISKYNITKGDNQNKPSRVALL
jgi:hypothetical protein